MLESPFTGLSPETFGADFVNAYSKLKNDEWRRFRGEVSALEKKHTLEC